MPQQDLKGLARLNGSKRLQYFFVEIHVGFERHLKGEAVCKRNIFPDRLEKSSILGRHDGLGSQPEVPEFNEEGLQGLDLEYLCESHPSEGAVDFHLFNYIIVRFNRFL